MLLFPKPDPVIKRAARTVTTSDSAGGLTRHGTYLYFRVTPQRLQAWSEANELDGRDLMRDGRWLVE